LYLDANIFIVYLTGMPPKQGSQVHAFFRELAVGAVVAKTTEGVLVEVTQVLVSKKGLAYPRAQISQELRKFLEFRGLRLDNLDVHLRALDRFGATNLDYVDCILIESADGPDDAVVSFDRDYDRALPGIRVEPGSLIQHTVRSDDPGLTGQQENEEPA
jgi:predicted nucleic acid-binding protein